jgi:hypothetical protein
MMAVCTAVVTSRSLSLLALGPALAFIFAMFVRTSRQLELLLLVEMISAIGALVVWALMPSMPKIAPSASAAAARANNITKNASSGGASTLQFSDDMSSFLNACKQACRNVSFVLLMTSGGIVFGVFQCWASSLTNVIPICRDSDGSGSSSGVMMAEGEQQVPVVPDRSVFSARPFLVGICRCCACSLTRLSKSRSRQAVCPRGSRNGWGSGARGVSSPTWRGRRGLF